MDGQKPTLNDVAMYFDDAGIRSTKEDSYAATVRAAAADLAARDAEIDELLKVCKMIDALGFEPELQTTEAAKCFHIAGGMAVDAAHKAIARSKGKVQE